MDAEITRSAPFYSDHREKHIAVKGLGKGDVLEYQVHWRPIKPLIPGQFWVDYNFHHNCIVLDEEIEIQVPADRAAKFKGPQATQAVKTEGDTRVYTWTYKNLQSEKESESEKKKQEALRGQLPRPDVQFSSFQSWEEVGSWYWGLQKDRIVPSAAVRAKAAELTKGLNDDAARVQALYRFVSMQYRYIGIAFGIGRYQPHSADDVLGNNYGDCKDKHTLLAALLQASGITLYPALIGSAHAFDPDVPSPGQFDHIIGYLPQGNGAIWLDTTPEVAAPGYLPVPLRDKPALVMMAEKSAKLIDTPADPPFANVQNFKIEGKLHDDGTLQAHVDAMMRGDTEVLLRTAFRRTPQPQWKDLVQKISYGLGYAGTVSEVDASAPDMIGEPFHFTYAYNRKDYPDWANRQFTVPGLPFLMPPVRDDAKDSVWLGALTEMVSDSKIELPKGYEPELPSDVDLKYDFAEYRASYKQDQGVLTAQRRLKIKMREVPVAELDDYRSFLKNLSNDVHQYVRTSSKALENPRGSARSLTLDSASSAFAEVPKLPDSSVQEANRLEEDARSAIRISDLSTAESALQKALQTDPRFTRAHIELSIAYMGRSKNDAALDELRRAIESDPKSLSPRRVYAYALSYLHRNDTALQVWRDILEL